MKGFIITSKTKNGLEYVTSNLKEDEKCIVDIKQVKVKYTFKGNIGKNVRKSHIIKQLENNGLKYDDYDLEVLL